MEAAILVEIWRGELLESLHRGHIAIVDQSGRLVAAWGDPDKVIYPRSSSKMLQALPLIESGAARNYSLGPEQLALACASHEGGEMHSARVSKWLAQLGLCEDDLLCGPQFPRDAEAKKALLCADCAAGKIHNNCSGKHAGFLTLTKHLGANSDYIDVNHPVQKAALEAFEEMTGASSPCHAIDGCSAPNFATTVKGLAHAMAMMSGAKSLPPRRQEAAQALREAMKRHPELVGGAGRACTELMQAMPGQTAIKTGAEAVYVAILPERGLGVALKIEDGSTRAAETAITTVLSRLGAADAAHPIIKKWMTPEIRNFAGLLCGEMRASDALYQNGTAL